MTALLLIIWLSSGVGGALIMQSKNREPWIGALLGFALGFIGLFITAVYSKRPAETA